MKKELLVQMQFLYNSETNYIKSFKSKNIKINKYKILYIFKKKKLMVIKQLITFYNNYHWKSWHNIPIFCRGTKFLKMDYRNSIDKCISDVK